jgi:hypothetical protein
MCICTKLPQIYVREAKQMSSFCQIFVNIAICTKSKLLFGLIQIIDFQYFSRAMVGRAASRGLRPRSRRAIRSITFAVRSAPLRWFRYYPSR